MNDIILSNSAPNFPTFQQKQLSGAVNQGAIAIEQERAIAETQGQLILAKRFPRSMASAHSDFMDACKSPEFASKAFYSVPNRGSGPSIRFMEEAARCYGNFAYGHRELSRSEGKSEIEVYAWDMEKNNRSTRQITVMHVLDTKSGQKTLTDQADIDNKIANVASKQIRGRISALMPKAMIEAGIAECRKTLAGANDKPVSQRVRDMTGAFSGFGVTVKHLESYLKHDLDSTTLDELIELIGVYNAIKEGTPAAEFFGKAEQQEEIDKTKSAILSISGEGAAKADPAKKPAPQTRKPAPSKPEPQAPEATQAAEPAQTGAEPQNSNSAEKVSNQPKEQAAQVASDVPATASSDSATTDDGGDVF